MSTDNVLKPSRYNLVAEDIHDYFLVVNTLSSAIVRVDNSTIKKVEKIFEKSFINIDSEEKELILLLADNGFLVPESLDELGFLKELHEKARNGEKALGLGIAPTLNCNFACVYCYQHHLPLDIPKYVEDAVIKYIKRNLPGRELLYVNWFGGEPTLKLKTIERISHTLLGICRENDCYLDSNITTNGYLLTKSVSKTLKLCGVNGVQVTIDGPPEIHNKRRYLKSGKGTFETILSNVIDSAHLFEEFIIRINIDKINAGFIPKLLDILNIVSNEVILAFRPATSPESPEKPDPHSLAPSEYLPLEAHLINLANEKGFSIQIGGAIPGTSFCSAYQRNAIMVDPYGDVHLCPVCVGRRSDRYGILEKDGSISKIGGIQSDWYAYDPLDDPECVKCIVLPLCMGGCLWYLGVPRADTPRCFLRHNIIEKIRIDHTLNRLFCEY